MAETDKAKFNSFGIRGMVERAGLLDGKLTVSGARGQGTAVLLTIPLISQGNDGFESGSLPAQRHE
jgi:glucose-6-phosphate-specific signal transduction histidine kinase